MLDGESFEVNDEREQRNVLRAISHVLRAKKMPPSIAPTNNVLVGLDQFLMEL
jgi:hypothetical protein